MAMRDEILKLADKLEAGERNDYLTSLEIRRIVAAEDTRMRVAQTDARCACDGEPDGE